ncbi:MAG: MATE family efflux transporter [Cyanobacteria bacterium P01_F01_bin.143]
MKSQLTEGQVSTQLLKLSLPMVWGILSILGFSLADTYFVAQLGTKELAAISFTFPVVSVLSSIAMGLGTGVSSVVARVIGKGDRLQVQRLTTDSLLLSVVIVGIFSTLGLNTIDPLFSSLGAKPELLPLIRDYMSIWYWGMTFLVVPLIGNSALRASGNTLIPSLMMTLAAGMNILLDPLFIFGWGSIPGLGLKGAAIASLISRVGILAASLSFLHFRERLLIFNCPSLQTLLKSWRSLLSVGLPAAATNLISPLSVSFATGLIAQYGTEAVAGFGLASRLEALALIVPLAISASLGPFVGQNWGAQLYSRVKRSLRLSFFFCLTWGVLIAVLLGTMGSGIAAWFDSDPGVVSSASVYLTLVPISYGALGIVFTASSALNGLGKPMPALGMSVFRLLLLYLPLSYLGSLIFGIPGIFAATCLSNVLVGLWAWSKHSRWINPIVEVTSSQFLSFSEEH